LKKTLLALALLAFLAIAIPAQKIEKPRLTAVPPTDAQRVLIDEGIAFHDRKRYDEAIRKYERLPQSGILQRSISSGPSIHPYLTT
jgi:outer membrane protein assembly factor BamD (BamD/ComL family)